MGSGAVIFVYYHHYDEYRHDSKHSGSPVNENDWDLQQDPGFFMFFNLFSVPLMTVAKSLYSG